MKRDHDLIFEDDHFLIRIDPVRESGIDQLEDTRCARDATPLRNLKGSAR